MGNPKEDIPMKAKKILSVSLALLALLSCVILASCQKKELSEISVGVISGPTGVGAVSLMEKAELGQTEGKYKFSLAADQEDAKAKFLNGEFDIVAMPTNLAATLYAKGEDIVVLNINTYGVLYILDATGEINNISDLSGKTIYTTGQGSNPEYILKYILEASVVENVNIEFKDASEISASMASGKIDIAMLPQPVATATVIQAKNNGLTINTAIDMTAEWERVASESALMMGCMVTTKTFLNEHEDEVNKFIAEYEASINAVIADVETAASLCEKHGILPKAAIAKQAIPKCNLCFVTGYDMKQALAGYLDVLYEADPRSIGGSMPSDDFYYMGYEK